MMQPGQSQGGYDPAISRDVSRHLPSSFSQRVRDAIFGHLLGDAFGLRYEFMTPVRLPRDLTWGGFGTHHQPPGTWSDDGALMLCLLESLHERGGFDPTDAGRRFVLWLSQGHMAAGKVVFDVGITTRRALERLGDGVAPLEAGPATEDDNGNGALMRILPLALSAMDAPVWQFLNALHDGSRMTHGHPCSQVCCAVYGLLVRHLLGGGGREEAWSATLKIADEAYASDPRWGQPYLRELTRIQAFGRRQGTGFVVDCLCSAWAAVAEARDFEDAIHRAVRYGHDTDTTAAVAGGLAGAEFGLGATATRWRDDLRLTDYQRALIESFVMRVLAKHHSRPTPGPAATDPSSRGRG